MPVYNYKGVNEAGRAIRGFVDAESDRSARAKLRRDGIFLTDLAVTKGGEAQREDTSRRRFSLEILRPVMPIDAALSSVELVRYQLQQSRIADAYRTAKAMMVLVQPLRRNRLAAAALTELLRCALTGRGLSAAFLDRVARGLERGRVQRAAKPARAPARSKRRAQPLGSQ